MAHAAVDYSDIWWAAGGTESGWGLNFAQSGDFIFATFFVYGTNGAPVWYTAQLSRTAGDSFTGPMLSVTGTYFGAPVFPPVPPANVVNVGTATFTATSTYSGTLRYTINGVIVNKNIERQTLTAQSITDVYLGGMSRTYAGSCPAGLPATILNTAQLVVGPLTTAPSTSQYRFYAADSTNVQLFCVMQGDPVQRGKIFTVTGGAYQCASGLSTTVEIDSIRALDNGIEMHWHANVGGTCVETGRLSAVKQ